MLFNPVKHVKGDKNRFCGPSAISIITGMSSGEAARLLRAVTGRASITGAGDGEMRAALLRCGVHMIDMGVKPEKKPNPKWSNGFSMEWPTIAKWIKDTAALRSAGRVFLVSAGHHWQVISGRRFCCGLTGDIVSFTHDKVKRRARVRKVFEIKVPRGITATVPACARKPAAQSKIDPSRVKLNALERKLGFRGKLEREGGYTDYVVPACDLFPRGFSTLHHDWWETMDRVEAAIEDYETNVDETGCMSR